MRTASRAVLALAAGAGVVALDTVALRGQISPVAVVALLLLATAAAGGAWGWRGWSAALVVWACVPLAHLVKHTLGLPDTLQPDTWESIRAMAAFTLAVSGAGFCGGGLLRTAVAEPAD